MKMKDIPPDNRPRERLLRFGLSALSDAEVLAIILRTGNNKENVVDMCNRLIAEFSLEKLSTLSLVELQRIKGIGPAKAMQIIASLELSKRASLRKAAGTTIKSSRDVYEYAKERIGDKNQEHFMIIHLNTKNKIIKDEIISIGTADTAIINPTTIFQTAIKENTQRLILTHNHPSGEPTPSTEDKEITNKLRKAGELLDIQILDHVIIGKNKHYGFKEEGGI